MYAPEILAILGLIISSSVFYLYARMVNKETMSLDGFMIADSTLNKSQFSNTFTASNVSLCLTVIFFGGNAKNLGLFLLASPITYLWGHFFFIWLLKQTKLDLSNCRTLADLVGLVFPNRAVVLLVSLMTLSSYILLVFVELYIGSVLFSFFLPQGILYQTMSFFAIGILVLMYVRLGGYRAIVKTDKWQLTLMILAIGGIFVYGLIVPVANDSTTQEVLFNMTKYTGDTLFGIIFSLWLALINSIYAFAQVSNWQRASATKDHDISWKGLINSSWKVIALFVIITVGFLLLVAKGYEFVSIVDYLRLVRDTGGISSYVIFPLMVVGFSSMVFSSADVAIIAVNYSLADKNSFLDYFSNLNEKALRRALSNTTLAILLILTIFYWLQFSSLNEWLMPIIFTACSQLGVLTPVPIFMILYLKKYGELPSINTSRRNILIFFNGMLLAWIGLFIGTYLSKTTGNQLFSLLPLPVGILFTLGAIITISNAKVQNNSQNYLL